MKLPFSKMFRRRKKVSRNERVEKYANHHSKTKSDFYRSMLPRVILGGVFILVAIVLLPPARQSKEVIFKAGEIADREIIAPFDFDVALSPEELEFAKAQAAVAVPPVYVRDRKIEEELAKGLESTLESLADLASTDTLTKEAKLDKIATLLPYLPRSTAKILLSKSVLKEISRAARRYQKQLLANGLIDNSGPIRRADQSVIVVLDGDKEKRVEVRDITDQGRVDRMIREKSLSLFKKNRNKAQVFFELVRANVYPNLILNVEETQKRRNKAMGEVRKFYTVSKNQRIIAKHDKVTKEQENVLKSLEKARASKITKRSPFTLVQMYVGEFLRLAIFLLLFGGYLASYHRKLYNDLFRLSAVFMVMVAYLLFLVAVVRFHLNPYLVPVAFVSLMLTALFNFRLGAVATVMASILIPLLTDFHYNIGFVSLAAGTVGALALKSLQARSHFYKVFLYMSLAYVLGIFGVELGQAEKMQVLYGDCFWGIAVAFFSSVSVMFLLPIFENIFNLTTRFTLLELTDLNKPILKRLNMEAHGTYHHSMLIGNIVDSVAQEVGADPLKTRVMAYYHDIGKIFKPEYYAENQDSDFNKHEKITPKMSSLILLAHVKDGVELAREEKLPDIVIDAIREHHGTTVMAYFYQKALETDSHSSVNRDDFRYPGPKPRSKESAILMLADTVEAACRSLKAPTAAHIRNMVEKLIDARAQEGQLDESGLTLNELAKIKEKFISLLTGIYHKRVAYPGQEKEEGEKNAIVAKPLGEKHRVAE
jgi:hypothetical protein